jgi:hypothetical protein
VQGPGGRGEHRGAARAPKGFPHTQHRSQSRRCAAGSMEAWLTQTNTTLASGQ